ncbi:MAG: hypothetical protein A2086_06725 [Spirochaetes bacterium GWD1_27_9]|nr:MAG: hypothetical protein A2Y34_10220 [Spirochaetes bacterium GWC1_27_15]OHD41333.1 MAG: hypothetical protein A2086_06725 [Spirochaetes bacterium GWD1_27_9]
MDKNITIKSDMLLAVEGKDESNFFKSLLEYENIQGVQIIDIGGKDKFSIEFRLLRNLEKFSNITKLAFVRDAEENNASSAFQSICDILKKYNLPYPQKINETTENSKPIVGVFIMPNNNNAGMFEDLCLESIKSLPINDCISKYIECVKNNLKSEDNEKFNISKAKVLTYLASKTPIVNSLGVGAEKKYWDFSDNCFSEIKSFLHKVFLRI